MPHRQFLKMLGATELFHEVPAAVLAEIGATARQQHFSANTRIFRQGEPDARAHLVIAGNVRISQSGSDGEQIVVRFIGPQETFGTVSLFTDRQYPAEAVTVVETLEASWSRTDIIGLIKQCPQIGLNALGIVGARLTVSADVWVRPGIIGRKVWVFSGYGANQRPLAHDLSRP